MADTVREIERKYEPGDEAGGAAELPDLTDLSGVASVADQEAVALDATYYDTTDQRLARDGLTLRRRTGGDDEGWHLKLPVARGVRDEVRAPLSDEVPRALAGLVRSRVRGAELVPVVRLRSERSVRRLLDGEGALLAEIAVDKVRARRLSGGARTAKWAEIEAELGQGAESRLLDEIEERFLASGLRPSAAPSKLARALSETAPKEKGQEKEKGKEKDKEKEKGRAREKGKGRGREGREGEGSGEAGPGPGGASPGVGSTSGEVVMAYVRAQTRAIVELDPAVRRDIPDSVHRMRVATRRLRGAFRSYGRVLDRTVTDPLGEELKWLAGELGVDRDREVLTARLKESLDALERPLRLGPVGTRLRVWSQARRTGSRRQVIAVLDGARHLALLQALAALDEAPPLLAEAGTAPTELLPDVVERDFRRLAARVKRAVAAPPGQSKDLAMHEARKAAKRTRYAAEAARPALGAPAKVFAARMTDVQELLGDHQDGVVAREALRDLAVQAHAAGENSFTFGVLYAREEARGRAREEELPGLWKEVSRKKLRRALRGG